MTRLLCLLALLILAPWCAVRGDDPTITITNPDQAFTITPWAPLTEATAKRLFGPALLGPATNVGAAHGANGWVTALADGTSASFSRPTRRRILYLNTSTTETVYAGFASGVNAATGFPINPGATFIQTSVVPMYFFSASGAARVAWAEAYD